MSHTIDTHDRRLSSLRVLRSSYWLDCLIVLAYLAARLLALTDHLPPFIDEMTLIWWARDMWHGLPFESVYVGKWLQVALVALFRPTGPETLWLARALTALASSLSCAAAIGIGRQLDSRLTGHLAGLLTLVAPLALIHERQALADSFMTVFVNLTLITVVWMVRTGKWRYVSIVALSVAAAILSKATALLFLPVPLAGGLILRGRGHLLKRLAQGIVAPGLALILVGAFVFYSDAHVEPHKRLTSGRSILSVACHDNHTDLCNSGEALPAMLRRAPRNLKQYAEIQVYYLGIPMFILAVSALTLLMSSSRRSVGYLSIVAFVLALALVLVAGGYWARYLTFTVTSLAILAAMVLSRTWLLSRRLAGDAARWRAVSMSIFGVLVILPMSWRLPVTLTWIRSPYDVVVPPPDGYGCNGFGYGLDHVGEALKEWSQESTARVSVVTTSPSLGAYWGERMGGIEGWSDDDTLRVQLAIWAMGGDTIFFADSVPSAPIPDSPFGATLNEPQTFSTPCEGEVVRLRRLVDEGSEIRQTIYELAFPNPNEFAEQYRAIAQHLIESNARGAVVVYPPNQLDLLENRLQWGTDISGVHAVGDSWPLDTADVADSLDTLVADASELHVVFLNEDQGDPHGFIRAWLGEHMTLVSQDWFGPVELLHYVAN